MLLCKGSALVLPPAALADGGSERSFVGLCPGPWPLAPGAAFGSDCECVMVRSVIEVRGGGCEKAVVGLCRVLPVGDGS